MLRRQFEYYILATRKAEKDEEVLVGVLITLLGVKGLKIFDTFVFATAGDEKKTSQCRTSSKAILNPSKVKFLSALSFCVAISNLVNLLTPGSCVLEAW